MEGPPASSWGPFHGFCCLVVASPPVESSSPVWSQRRSWRFPGSRPRPPAEPSSSTAAQVRCVATTNAPSSSSAPIVPCGVGGDSSASDHTSDSQLFPGLTSSIANLNFYVGSPARDAPKTVPGGGLPPPAGPPVRSR
jgi:hypothetical protein